MANTYARNLQYAYTNLHTNSAYMGPWSPNLYENGSVNDQIFNARIEAAIDALEARENAFANKFGYGTLEELMSAIHKLFEGDFNKDLQILEKFKSDNLRAILHKKFDNNSFLLEGQKVRLILDSTKTEAELQKVKEKLEEVFNFSFGNRDFKIVSKVDGTTELTIGLEWDVPNVKRVVNAVQGTHFVYNTTGKNGVDNTSRTKADYRLVEHLKNNVGAMVKVRKGKGGKYSTYDFRTSPLAYRGSELSNLSQEEVNKIDKLIRDFIFNEMTQGASQYMKNAIAQVWNQNINKIGIEFFLGGKGWIDHLIGAMGEFVTPVFFYYCATRLPNSHLVPAFMSLIGQERNRFKEQRSIDIEIAFLQAAGIQVKNYNGAFVRDKATHAETSKERTIDVNLHPSDISSLAHDPRIVPYIVNSYFNTNIRQIPESVLQKFFEYHAYEFLNLAIDDSQIEDRATFYLIGGYFIPGSAILRAAFVTQSIKVSNTSIKFNGNLTSGSDSFYAERGYTTTHGHIGPNFLKWWHGNQYMGWTPTDNNNITQYEANITLHTRFTYSALFKAEYKIF